MDESSDFALLGFDKETMLSILKRAGSQERTVVEFQTVENEDGELVIDHVKEITRHVAELENTPENVTSDEQ